ncbi:DUF2254 domain-containing protein [Naumannella huperziae]
MTGNARAAEQDSLPDVRSTTVWGRIWRPFWVLPLVIIVVVAVVGLLLPEAERAITEHLPFVFEGGADGARSMLGTIAGAMISVTGLVFSITMVVVQLASSQFTPRVLNDFLSSRVTQATLGIFTATFVYALTVLRSVRGTSDTDSYVPQLSVTLAFVLVLASVGMFLAYIHHITRSIQVSAIVSQLGAVTMDVVTRYFPAADGPRPPEPDRPRPAAEPVRIDAVEHGVVAEISLRRLRDWATEHDALVEVLIPIGQFVAEGMPVLRVWAPGTVREDVEPLRVSVVVEEDRGFHQDPALGIRKLVDIGERALSPGINDPTTAVQVTDELHRILRALVVRRDLTSVVAVEGTVRLVHRPQRIAELVALALDELLHYGKDSPQIPPRVLAMLRDLQTVALPEHAETLRGWERIADDAARRLARSPGG